MEMEAILNLIKKFKEILTLKALGAFGLVCLLFGFLGAGDLFGSLYFKELLFMGSVCTLIVLFYIIGFGWNFYSEKREQKRKDANEIKRKKQKQEQEKKKRQENIGRIITIIKSLNDEQVRTIAEVARYNKSYIKIDCGKFFDFQTRFQVGVDSFLELEKKGIGKCTAMSHSYTITFEFYQNIGEILRYLYLNERKLFERPDE